MTEGRKMLPEGQYLQIESEDRLVCVDCLREDHFIAVSNEIIFDTDGTLLGIDAVVRFVQCGHRVPGARADPIKIAAMLERYEKLVADDGS